MAWHYERKAAYNSPGRAQIGYISIGMSVNDKLPPHSLLPGDSTPIDSRIVKKIVLKELSRIQTISDLALLLGSSADSLKKGFMRRERISLSEYLSEIRIERAKELLLKSNLKCKQICLAVGYSREDVGSRAFKRHNGISMSEFRKIEKMQREFDISISKSAK